MADEGLLIPIQFTLEEARAALSQLEAQARAAGQRAGEGVSRGVEGGLQGLKKSMGPARETAMFFTQSLGEFGPAGRTAQIAITGLAGAFIGGGGLLAGLGLAQAAFRLVTSSMEEADARAKATSTAMRQLTDATRAAYQAEVTRLAGLQGFKTIDTARQLLDIARQETQAKKDLADATWFWQSSSARARLDELRATREQILAIAQETTGLKSKNAAIEMGAAANAEAWKRQEAEAARLTALEDQRRAKAKAQREADARAGDAAAVARVNAELAEEVRAANERAAMRQAEEDAKKRARDAEIDHESFLMEWREARHLEVMAAIEAEHRAFLESMPMDALRSFTSSVALAFTPVLTTSAAYTRAMRAAGKATVDSADLSAAAFAALAQNAMASMATEAAGRALFETAAGFASWAWYDWNAARNHFASAAIYGSVAALGGAGAIAIGATRGMTAAEKASVADAAGQESSIGSAGGAREFGGGGSAGGTVTIRETVYVGVVANDFESPAETARRAARVMELVGQLDLMRREDG